MKMFITNLDPCEFYASDIVNAKGEMVRIRIPPLATVEVLNIDPYFINQDKNLRYAIFRDNRVRVWFTCEFDDLVPVPVDSGWRYPVCVATTGPITLKNLQTIDGVALVDGDRVLVKDQADATQNGIYIVRPGDWERAPDAGSNCSLVANTTVWVQKGTTHGDQIWYLSVDPPINVGTTPLIWTEFVGGGGATAASIFDFGADRIGNTTTTRYLFPGYAEDLAETSSSNEFRMPRAGTLRNFYVIHNVLGGGPVVITYTVEVNGVATSLAVGLAANSALGANTTISVPVVAGDRVRVRVTKAANVAGPNNVHATVEIA